MTKSVNKRIALLSDNSFGPTLIEIGYLIREDISINLISSKKELIEIFESIHFDLLVSFGTSVIVPKKILNKKNLIAVNIHAASPKYPGRDPHHFAVYDKATEYGATLHFMIKKVDAGPIINVEIFSLKKEDSPIDLLTKANKAGIKLYRKLIENFDRPGFFKENRKYQWNKKKSTRQDFKDLCHITPEITHSELNRRIKACSFPGYSNLFTEIIGKKFVLIDGYEL